MQRRKENNDCYQIYFFASLQLCVKTDFIREGKK
jgi:hypothetical protein